jgi:pyridinium-3,5-biscarboxylic acid mononucleotide synthase
MKLTIYNKLLMNNKNLENILKQYQDNKVDIESVISFISSEKQKSEVVIDHSRRSRCGFPEFIYGAGKNAEQIALAVEKIKASGESVLVTRISEEKYSKIKNKFPEAVYDKSAEALIIKKEKNELPKGNIAIVTAGTSDIPIAAEARYTAELCNCKVNTYFDIGVAGIHRLFGSLDEIKKADVVICIAGMEGALPSVLAGLVSCPVIAVPTSVGYGTSLNGFTALFAMLTSCASGVTVVNIDNGFGAACAAVRIVNQANK